jgi:hypothetical protein
MIDVDHRQKPVAAEGESQVNDLGSPPPPLDPLSLACRLGAESAERIASQFGSLLDRADRQKVCRTFDRILLPRRTPGRKRKKSITLAFTDWKAGVRGTALYRKHIPHWERHSNWRRRGEQRALMDAIYSRERRDKKRQNQPACLPG